MPTLTPGQPLTVDTPELLVENRLRPGTHRFQLVVIDEAGLESRPAELEVTVERRGRPAGPFNPDLILRPDVLEQPDLRVLTDILRPPRRPQ